MPPYLLVGSLIEGAIQGIRVTHKGLVYGILGLLSLLHF